MSQHQAKITPTNTDLMKEQAQAFASPVAMSIVAPEMPVLSRPEAEIPLDQPKPLKIAIIGTAPSSRSLAPYNDPTWTIWACSPGNMNIVPRVDAWFEIHSNLLWPENQNYGAPYVEWLKKQTFPIYMQDQSLVPQALTYPAEEMVREFGRYFFTSSFAWMMALAIMQGAKEIALFGVDMASKDEYILQRSGGHYFIQEAAKRGIRVILPKESDLMQPPALYGYSDSTHFVRKISIREQEIKDRVAHLNGEIDRCTHQRTYLQGALEDIDYIKTIWGGVQQ